MIYSNKNICLFNSCKTWGGGEKWHFETAKYLTQENFNILVCTYPESELSKRICEKNILCYQTKVRNLSFLNPIKILNLFLLFKKHKIETIILGLPSDVKLAGLAAKFAGVKKIVYRRGSAVAVRNSFINRYLFRKVLTEVITNSKEISEKLLANNPKLIDTSKIHIIYNTVNTLVYRPYEKPNNTNGLIRIGSAGRLVEQKAQWHLLDIAKKLKQENIDFKIEIAGKGPLFQKLQEIIISEDLINEVKLLGFREDIPQFLNSIDIFILTSQHEGSSNIVLEAMACGKPIIAYNVSSLPELINNNESGFLIAYNNNEEVVRKIMLLNQNRNMLQNFGKKSVELVKERHSPEVGYKQLIKVLEIDS